MTSEMNSDAIEKRGSLPYAIEYAKSGRSTCKKCQSLIQNDTLRISVREPSTYFDGLQDNWFHFACFWQKIRPGKDMINEESIRGVDWIKWEDQEMLRSRITKFRENRISPEKVAPVFMPRDVLNLASMKVEQAPSKRGKCGSCSAFFDLGETKCHYKGRWLHPRCLFEKINMVVGTVDQIIKWDALAVDARQPVIDAYNDKMQELLKKRKTEERELAQKEGGAETDVSVTTVATSVIALVDVPSSSSSLVMSPSNEQGTSNELKRIADDGIERTSEIQEEDEGAKRRKLAMDERKAKRKKDKLKAQAEKMWELRKVFEGMSESERKEILVSNDQDIPSGTDAVIERLVDCALYGRPAPCPQCSNGRIFFSSSYKTYVCTGYATEYAKCMYDNKNPLRTPFAILNKLKKKYNLENVYLNTMVDRLYNEEEEVVKPGTSSSFKYLGARRFKMNNDVADEAYDGHVKITSGGFLAPSANTGVSRQIIKKGTVVDAEFPHAESCHVYKDKEGGLYSATMTFTDLMCNKNSYYKMQLLRHDSRLNDFYLFRSWGRVGTNVGNTMTTSYNEEGGIHEFCKIFKEKTNNEWKYRKFFRKFPGLFSYCETDYSEFEELGEQEVIAGSKTLLPKPVKEIIMSIFDVENMKLAMKSFEMDVNKLPLGKLSKKQIMSAYTVLTELQNLLSTTGASEIKLMDATNKFFTIIPHNFGMKAPEPIDTFKKIKEKSDMLDMLLDIQFAYDQIKTDSAGRLSNIDPVDANYEKLKCSMTPIDRQSYEYTTIVTYMKNTHGSSHVMDYDLLDILRIERSGESNKFKQHLGNRMLLWHGSGKMNYAGILGQGLRIAPPEAPASGYMFGKGVYFADMFTKSSFYCRPTPNEEAYMLLCDVALGVPSMHKASVGNMSKANLPKGCSSVKGVGRERPDPSGDLHHPDGYVIPCGRASHLNPQADGPFHLLYNEYIVYDTDQIQLKYLVRLRVKRANHRL